MPHPYAVVDAFTDEPLTGNPAAVVLLEDPASPDWMGRVAAEFNLSETAFLVPEGEVWSLRWFTPTVEVDLCGHATLASAHVLAGRGATGTLAFATRSGRLTCQVTPAGIRMDLPADPVHGDEDPDRLEVVLGGVPVVAAGRTRGYVVAEVADAGTVADVAPDLAAVRALGDVGLVVTARGDDVEVVSRMFAPQHGIDEDPVTGSAHCALACWWADRVGTSWRARQLSARGGRLDVELLGDRVALTGRAVTVATGQLHA